MDSDERANYLSDTLARPDRCYPPERTCSCDRKKAIGERACPLPVQFTRWSRQTWPHALLREKGSSNKCTASVAEQCETKHPNPPGYSQVSSDYQVSVQVRCPRSQGISIPQLPFLAKCTCMWSPSWNEYKLLTLMWTPCHLLCHA